MARLELEKLFDFTFLSIVTHAHEVPGILEGDAHNNCPRYVIILPASRHSGAHTAAFSFNDCVFSNAVVFFFTLGCLMYFYAYYNVVYKYIKTTFKY